MGKNKWSNETEGSYNPPFQSTKDLGRRGSKKLSNLPGYFNGRTNEALNFTTLVKAFLQHFRRKWLSLRFRTHKLSNFAFNKSFLIKCGILCIGTYVLFNGKPETGAAISNGITPGTWDDETTFSVGSDLQAPKKKKLIKKPASEAAPLSKENLRSDRSINYIKKYHGLAQQEMRKYGVPASISLAQGLIESRAGTSKLAVNNNNHFGMKCFSRNCKKGHCTNFTDDTHKDFFRKFKKASESWRAHSIMVSSGRYAKLKKYGNNYRKWAIGLKSVGYATDKHYAQKIIGIVERYDLHQYDN